MVPAEALSPEKRAQILAGAATIFGLDGYEGASMSRIAAEANVSKGTLYNYFESKADLFVAFIEQSCSEFLSEVFAGAEDQDDLYAGLSGIARRMIAMMTSPTGQTIHRIVVSEAVKFPALARSFYEAGPARATGAMAAWLHRQAQAGRLRIGDPSFAADQFFALCQARIGLQCRLNLRPPPSETEITSLVEAAVRMFMQSYETPSS